MAKKAVKKQKTKKTDRNKLKSAAKKTPSKPKRKTGGAVKPSSRKPSGKKKLLKTRKQPAKKIKARTTARPAIKKVSSRTRTKPGTKIKRRARKSPEIIESERKAALRKLLINKREEIVTEVKSVISKYIKGETRQLVDTALDDGDWSIVDLSEDISFKHMSTHRENLVKIDEALRKLTEGTYGICEDCGDEISEERLKILPFAIYCIDCQEKREQIEEMQKAEGIPR
jgi:DnaK suppressor protein